MIQKWYRKLALAFGAWAATSGVYGLWTVASYAPAFFSAPYVLPFDFIVPTNVAGDLYVTMIFIGMAIFILVVK